jgi:hypothetical protein
MKPISGTLTLLVSVALCLSVQAQDAANPSPAPASPASDSSTVSLSNIRIVRLSQVRGKVSIDRHIGRGYEDAFANIPITTGARLRTGIGLAEVEFEDNSTLRLTPDTEVEFTALKRTLAGPTISSITVLRGMVYASLASTKGNTFTVSSGNASIALNPSSHIRFTADGPSSNLAVFDGTVQFTLGSSTITRPRKTALAFDLSGSNPATAVKLQETAFDQWDKDGNQYQKQYSSLRSAGINGLYGASDLNYYGDFVNMPGCGSLWRPYFASAAWTPFDNGVWAYYPSAGYSWVSPYPWGWLPFHSGTWMSCGAAGWGWQPGAAWVGLQNVATLVPAAGNRALAAAPAPPRRGAPAMVPVNARPLAVSSISAPGTFTFRNNSAGLGIPRDGFGELKHISSSVARHGLVDTEIERTVIGPSPSFGNSAAARGASTHDPSPGSRSVATFNRPGNMRANRGDGLNAGWSGMPRDSMRGPGPANSPMPRSSSPAAPPQGNRSSSPGSAGASRK